MFDVFKFKRKKPSPEEERVTAPSTPLQAEVEARYNLLLLNAIRKLDRKITFQIILLLVVATLASVFGFQRDRNVYFAVTDDYRFRDLTPLSQPLVARETVLNLALRGTVASYTYTWRTIEADFERASSYFTPDGWIGFNNALRASGNLDTLSADKLTSSAFADIGRAKIIRTYLDKYGRVRWEVEFPFTVSQYTPSAERDYEYTATVDVVRVSEAASPYGIGIEVIRTKAR